jgi:hypothetical protein
MNKKFWEGFLSFFDVDVFGDSGEESRQADLEKFWAKYHYTEKEALTVDCLNVGNDIRRSAYKVAKEMGHIK